MKAHDDTATIIFYRAMLCTLWRVWGMALRNPELHARNDDECYA